MCVCVFACTCYYISVEVRGQVVGIGSLLLPFVSQRPNSGYYLVASIFFCPRHIVVIIYLLIHLYMSIHTYIYLFYCHSSNWKKKAFMFKTTEVCPIVSQNASQESRVKVFCRKFRFLSMQTHPSVHSQ